MSVLQTVQKNNRQFTYGQTVQKNCTGAFTVLQTVQKNNNSNLHMDRQCKKATAIYIWTVHIYRLYRRQCAKYTYIYSVHIVYYKDILNYQRHQDKKTMSSSEDEVDSLFEESMVGRINSLEKFAAEEFSKLKKLNQTLQDTLNERMTSDMAAVKAELSALKTRVADQDRQLQELKKELDDKTSGAPTHTEVQEKRPASSPDWTPEQKKSRSEEGLDKILEPFWPERPDARERLSERQQAFFLYMMDQLKVKGECFKSLHCLTRKRSLNRSHVTLTIAMF